MNKQPLINEDRNSSAQKSLSVLLIIQKWMILIQMKSQILHKQIISTLSFDGCFNCCIIFLVAEVTGGQWAYSLTILPDAAHMFSDMTGFFISIFSIWLGLFLKYVVLISQT